MIFELAGVANETTGSGEGLHEVDDAVGATVLALAVGENPVEPPPFRGLAGVVFETAILQGTRGLIARSTFSELSRK